MNERLLTAYRQLADYWDRVEFGRENKLAWVAAFIAVILAAVWVYRRDAVEISRVAKYWLMALRLSVLGLLLIIAMQPEIPDNKMLLNPSRVAVLIDTSLSMSISDKQPTDPATAEVSSQKRPRVELVEELLAQSDLIDDLRKRHELSIYTFDSKITEQHRLSRTQQKEAASGIDVTSAEEGAVAETEPEQPIDWTEMIKPRGLETRMGEALLEIVRREAGPTLSGLVLIGDGVSNTGVEPATAIKAAAAGEVKLFTVGVGGTETPVNLQVADVQSPTSVHVRDGFSITAHIRGEGLAGKEVRVELYSKPEEAEGDPVLVAEETQTLGEDDDPIPVLFNYTPSEPGRRVFFIRTRPVEAVEEIITEDNESKVTVEINERKVKVLLIAGGPMRDYRFVRNLLFRDSSIELNVWLQTAEVGISQESDELLFELPKDRQELFSYDVIIAFDADWQKIPVEQVGELTEWVFEHAAGMIIVSGEVYTPIVASMETGDPYALLKDLYPVVLEPRIFDSPLTGEEFTQAWPLDFTTEGEAAGFLQLDDNPATSMNLWTEFPGVYRTYMTRGPKAGATVFAYFSDPRFGEGDERPIIMASQFYGAGRVLYLGSPEMWRLRAIDEDYYDRLWVQLVREVGQGRLLRGTTRGVLFLERDRYALGSNVQVSARVLDAQLKKLVADSVTLEVFDPDGKPLTPAVKLNGEPTQPGRFQGNFPVTRAGTYRLELQVPESKEQIVKRIEVKFPNLERQRPQQDVQLLRSMARDTGGTYLPIREAAKQLPEQLKDQSITTVQTGFPDPQWDEAWVMYLLVGLLGMEWLTRKLLKLA